MPSHVFLSYAQTERDRIRPLAEAMEERGLDVFWDYELQPGQEWRDVIGARLEDAGCVVVAWTHESIGRRWVREEASRGANRRILVPVRLDDVAAPLGFGEIHAADLTGWAGDKTDERIDRLCTAVRAVLGMDVAEQPEEDKQEQDEQEKPPEPVPWRDKLRRLAAVALPVAAAVAVLGLIVWNIIRQDTNLEIDIEVASEVEVGGDVAIALVLRNTGDAEHTDLRVTCTIPRQLAFDRVEVKSLEPAPSGPLPALDRSTRTRDTATYLTAEWPRLAAGSTLRLHVLARAEVPGSIQIEASVKSDELPRPEDDRRKTRVVDQLVGDDAIRITASRKEAITGEEITFEAAADLDVKSWVWDLGDGGPQRLGQKVTHVYDHELFEGESGPLKNLTVTVVAVTDDDVARKHKSIALHRAVEASFTYTKKPPFHAPMEVTFQGSSPGDVKAWMWTITGGSRKRGRPGATQVAMLNAGTATVRLEVVGTPARNKHTSKDIRIAVPARSTGTTIRVPSNLVGEELAKVKAKLSRFKVQERIMSKPPRGVPLEKAHKVVRQLSPASGQRAVAGSTIAVFYVALAPNGWKVVPSMRKGETASAYVRRVRNTGIKVTTTIPEDTSGKVVISRWSAAPGTWVDPRQGIALTLTRLRLSSTIPVHKRRILERSMADR